MEQELSAAAAAAPAVGSGRNHNNRAAPASRKRNHNQPGPSQSPPAAVQESQDLEMELEEFDNNGRRAGAGGFSASKIAKQSIFVMSGVAGSQGKIDEITKEFLQKNNQSLLQNAFIVGGKTIHYPDVQLSCHGQEDKFEENQIKFFSMIIPTKLLNRDEEYRFFIRRGPHKVGNESMLELKENEIEQIERKFANSFWPFLVSINGKRFNSVNEIPKKPDAMIVRDIDEKNKIVFRIEDYQVGASGKIMPNLSIKQWEYKKRGWGATDRGISMGCYNFFLFITVTLKMFVPNVKLVFDNLSGSIKDLVEGDEIENDPNDDEIEPFPN